MKDFFETSNWKILVLILLGVFGVILITGNLVNRSFESEIPKEVLAPSATKAVPKVTSSFPSTSLVSWKFYKTDQYEITYPSDWKTESFFHKDGKETVRIKPLSLSGEEYYPSIDISVENASSASKLENFYSSMPAFRKIGNKYMTTSMTKMVGKEKIKSPVQEIAVFIYTGERAYFLEYRYDGEKENNEQEFTFNRIISSLKSL